jgi:hypothetical protein
MDGWWNEIETDIARWLAEPSPDIHRDVTVQ